MQEKSFASAVYIARKSLRGIFGNVDFIDLPSTMLFKKPKIDIIKLDDYLIYKYGYDIEKHGSQSDFIKSKFGIDAEKTVRNLL